MSKVCSKAIKKKKKNYGLGHIRTYNQPDNIRSWEPSINDVHTEREGQSVDGCAWLGQASRGQPNDILCSSVYVVYLAGRP
jgi:hypothetical protein